MEPNKVEANQFTPRSSANALNPISRYAGDRLGTKAIVAVVSAHQNVRTEDATHKPKGDFFPVCIATRVRQHRMMAHGLLRALNMIGEEANVDQFKVGGDTTLSGLLHVTLEPGYTPSGNFTVLTATGSLNAAGLALSPSDSAQFSLDVVGNILVLNSIAVGLPGDYNVNGVVDGGGDEI